MYSDVDSLICPLFSLIEASILVQALLTPPSKSIVFIFGKSAFLCFSAATKVE